MVFIGQEFILNTNPIVLLVGCIPVLVPLYWAFYWIGMLGCSLLIKHWENLVVKPKKQEAAWCLCSFPFHLFMTYCGAVWVYYTFTQGWEGVDEIRYAEYCVYLCVTGYFMGDFSFRYYVGNLFTKEGLIYIVHHCSYFFGVYVSMALRKEQISKIVFMVSLAEITNLFLDWIWLFQVSGIVYRWRKLFKFLLHCQFITYVPFRMILIPYAIYRAIYDEELWTSGPGIYYGGLVCLFLGMGLNLMWFQGLVNKVFLSPERPPKKEFL